MSLTRLIGRNNASFGLRSGLVSVLLLRDEYGGLFFWKERDRSNQIYILNQFGYEISCLSNVFHNFRILRKNAQNFSEFSECISTDRGKWMNQNVCPGTNLIFTTETEC